MREKIVPLVTMVVCALLASGCLEMGAIAAAIAAGDSSYDDYDYDYPEYDDYDPYYDGAFEVSIDATTEQLGAAGVEDAYLAVFWQSDAHPYEDDRFVAGYGYATAGRVSGYASVPLLDAGYGPSSNEPSVGTIIFLDDAEPCPQYTVLPVPSAERTLAEAPQRVVHVPPGALDVGSFEEGLSCALPGDGGAGGVLAGLAPVDCGTAFGDVAPL